MSTSQYLTREESFYRFLMISAYASTLVFGGFYFFAGVQILFLTTLSAFLIFLILGALSFYSVGIVTLFRLSILTILIAFYLQVFFTGGSQSSAYPNFLIPPLLAFFYKPIHDRYFFMILSGACVISMLPLSLMDLPYDLVPEGFKLTHGVICTVFIFASVIIYTFMFRNALIRRNEKMGDAMKKLQETTRKLIQSEKLASLGMLSAGVAHEINNPLNFIQGGLQLLEQGLEDEKELKFEATPCLNVMKEGLRRASIIVKSLNHFSRDTETMNESCDLHQILNNSLVMLQPKLKYKGEVKKLFTSEKLVISGNEGKLHQAFLNIISNAEQAIQKDGLITISTIKKKKRIYVEIADNGIGITKENLKKISDPFFTTKPVGKGTGLGLSITYKIIEEHKGIIKVKLSGSQNE